MSEPRQFSTICPGGPNIHLKFHIDGILNLLATAPYGFRDAALAAIARAVQVACRVDLDVLQREMSNSGVPNATIEEIFKSITFQDQLRLRECGQSRSRERF